MAALLIGGLLVIVAELVPTLLLGTVDLNQGSLEISKRTVTDGGTTLYLVNGVNTWKSGNETSGISLRADDGPERILMPESDLSPSVHHTFRNPDIPETIHITNVGPPICVGGFKIEYPDGTNLSINGNLGKTCHAKHYEGQNTAFLTNDPSCTWIDHNDPESPGMIFNMTILQWSDINVNFTDKTDLCKEPFTTREKWTSTDTRKRTSHTDFTGTLIKSNLAINSAARLCNDTASVGPDFAALSEGLYCDMDTKEIYPICKDGQVSGCFRAADNVLVGDSGAAEGAKVSERAVQIMKAYDHVVVWE